MADIIKIKRDTAANWAANNPVLSDGEFGYDKTNKMLKIGDGATAWSGLGYVPNLADVGARRTASVVIAASGSSAADKAGADYICPGVVANATTGDEAIIYAAIDALPECGGDVYIRAGTYYFYDMLNVNKNNIHIKGYGAVLDFPTSGMYDMTHNASCQTPPHYVDTSGENTFLNNFAFTWTYFNYWNVINLLGDNCSVEGVEGNFNSGQLANLSDYFGGIALDLEIAGGSWVGLRFIGCFGSNVKVLFCNSNMGIENDYNPAATGNIIMGNVVSNIEVGGTGTVCVGNYTTDPYMSDYGTNSVIYGNNTIPDNNG